MLIKVATPPNAIVFAAGGGDISIMEMVKVMLVPKFVTISFVLISHVTFGSAIFDFSNFSYANSSSTIVA